MKHFVRSFCSAAILGVGAAVVWNRFLDDKAKASLKRCASVTGGLANHLIASYMQEGANESDAGAAKQNQDWVASQWSNIGY